MDTFGGGTGVLLVGIFEMVGIMWVYGVQNFSRYFFTTILLFKKCLLFMFINAGIFTLC